MPAPSAMEQNQPTTELFPASKEEAQEFVGNMISLIHNEETTTQILDAISSSPSIEEGIAQVVAMLFARVIVSVKEKMGRDTQIPFIIKMFKPVIQEIYALLVASGKIKEKPDKNAYAMIGKMAGDQLQNMLGRMQMVQEQEGKYKQAGGPPMPPGGGAPQEEQMQGPPAAAPSALGGM